MIRTLSSRLAALAVLATATLLLGGCAAMNRLDNEVSTYGAWPSDRKPARFAFERLPSQQARPERQQVLEDAARGALEEAGFVAAVDPVRAEFGVEVGARVSFNDPWYDSDPLFWRGSLRDLAVDPVLRANHDLTHPLELLVGPVDVSLLRLQVRVAHSFNVPTGTSRARSAVSRS